MKKVLFLATAFILFIATANAQTTKEEMQASQKRIETLQKFATKAPKATGIQEVDDYAKAVYDAAILSVNNSEQLSNFYYRSIGETKDGVADVTIKKPSLEECLTLSETIAAEAKSAKDAVNLAKLATEKAKGEKSPLKAGKIAGVMKSTTDAAPVLTQESVFQVKAIADIINTIKTGNNL